MSEEKNPAEKDPASKKKKKAPEKRVLKRISRDQIIADTVELIRGRGENPGDTEAETVKRLKLMCERIGATVTTQEFLPGRENLRAALGPEDGPAILFLGHTDVVPAGEGWTIDPFDPLVTEDAIIGRGSTDMKGGLAAVVMAMSEVHRVAPWMRLELLATGDEEDRSLGLRAALQTEVPRKYLACIVAEPTDMDVVIGCRGASNFLVHLTGASAHAGRPEDGASSIYAAGKLIELVRRKHALARSGAQDPLLGSPTWNVGTIEGGSGTSMVAQDTTVTLDRRTMPDEDSVEILSELLDEVRNELESSEFANAESVEVVGSVDMVMPGFRTSPDSEVAKTASRVLVGLGHSGEMTGWSAACEGGFIARFHEVPTIVLGPGDINNEAHQPDEEVKIDDLVAAAKAYAQIAVLLGKPFKPEKHKKQ